MNSYYLVQGNGDVDPTAWIALFVAASSLGWTVWNELTGYRRKQADEYWYRNVFSPNCIEPVVELLNSHLEALRAIDVASVTEADLQVALDEFVREKEVVLGRLWISQLFSPKFYGMASRELDTLEDEMAQQFAKWSFDVRTRTDDSLESLRKGAISRTTSILLAASNISLSKFGARRKEGKLRRKIRAFFEA